MTRPSRLPKLNGLGGLKVIAMLLLFWFHCPIPCPYDGLGARCCEFLFLASGFLVAYNASNKEVPATWKESFVYTGKKVMRFWPLHLIILFLVATAYMYESGFAAFATKTNLAALIANAFLVQAWCNSLDVAISFNGASWFLSALIFCYFMSPVLLQACRKTKTAILLFPIVYAMRYYVEFFNGWKDGLLWKIHQHVFPPVHCLEFFMGMLLCPIMFAIIRKLKERNLEQYSFPAFSILEIAVLGMTAYLWTREPFSMRAPYILASSLLLFVFVFDRGVITKALTWKPILEFSAIQFEVFIWHTPIMKLCRIYLHLTNLNVWLCSAIEFIILMIVAYVYHYFLSDRITKQMHRIYPFSLL